MKQYRPRLNEKEYRIINESKKKVNRVLVVGDLHLPFEKKGYLEFCKEKYDLYNCNQVVFIGDILDNHYPSYHETYADGMGGRDELDLSIERLSNWYKTFPCATVTIGNHDRIIMRKSQTSNIPSRWIKEYKEVLNTPNWNWVESIEIDDIVYTHGEGGTARNKAKNDLQSYVQGHFHSQAYIEYFVGNNRKIFGMQVGSGIDRDCYAFSYGKHFKKQVVSCGIVIDGTPYLELMELGLKY